MTKLLYSPESDILSVYLGIHLRKQLTILITSQKYPRQYRYRDSVNLIPARIWVIYWFFANLYIYTWTTPIMRTEQRSFNELYCHVNMIEMNHPPKTAFRVIMLVARARMVHATNKCATITHIYTETSRFSILYLYSLYI